MVTMSNSSHSVDTATPRALVVRLGAAATMLCVNRSTLYRLLLSGRIRSVKLGRARLIPIAELERWIRDELELSGGAA